MAAAKEFNESQVTALGLEALLLSASALAASTASALAASASASGPRPSGLGRLAGLGLGRLHRNCLGLPLTAVECAKGVVTSSNRR